MTGGEEYIGVLTFLGTGILFLLSTFLLSKALRPDNPDKEKLSTYECGEEAVGDGQVAFNSRFFIVAVIFVLFEVEVIFLFPWAIVFSNPIYNAAYPVTWATLALVEMLVFVFILSIGLVYAWSKGHLEWIRPETTATKIKSKIPLSKYEEVNIKYS